MQNRFWQLHMHFCVCDKPYHLSKQQFLAVLFIWPKLGLIKSIFHFYFIVKVNGNQGLTKPGQLIQQMCFLDSQTENWPSNDHIWIAPKDWPQNAAMKLVHMLVFWILSVRCSSPVTLDFPTAYCRIDPLFWERCQVGLGLNVTPKEAVSHREFGIRLYC